MLNTVEYFLVLHRINTMWSQLSWGRVHGFLCSIRINLGQAALSGENILYPSLFCYQVQQICLTHSKVTDIFAILHYWYDTSLDGLRTTRRDSDWPWTWPILDPIGPPAIDQTLWNTVDCQRSEKVTPQKNNNNKTPVN